MHVDIKTIGVQRGESGTLKPVSSTLSAISKIISAVPYFEVRLD